MTDNTKAPTAEIFGEALKNYEQTLRAGLKLQEEAGAWWTNVLTQAGSAQDWHKRMSGRASEILTPTQKRMEEYLALVEQNNRTNVELLKQAMEAAQTTTPADCQAKWFQFYQSSLNAMKNNFQAVRQSNSKISDSLMTVVKKSAAEFEGPKASKA